MDVCTYMKHKIKASELFFLKKKPTKNNYVNEINIIISKGKKTNQKEKKTGKNKKGGGLCR